MHIDDAIFDYRNMMRGCYRLVGDFCDSMGSLLSFSFDPVTRLTSDYLMKSSRYFNAQGIPLEKNKCFLENTVIRTFNDKSDLRKYTERDSDKNVLVITAEAGHGQALDISDGKSIVQRFVKDYSGDVYGLTERPAGPEHIDYSLDEMVVSVIDAMETLKSPVDLVLQCSAVWRGIIAASLRPDLVRSMTMIAGPVDFFYGNPKITKMARLVPEAYSDAWTMADMGVMPGFPQLLGFQSMSAEKIYDHSIGRHIEYWLNCDDPDWVEKRHKDEEWFYSTQAIGGKASKEIGEMFRKNLIVKKQLYIDYHGRKLVDLSNIKDKTIFLVGAENDDITPPEQAFRTADHLDPSNKIEQILIPGAGHLGAISGRKAMANEMRYIAQKIENL